MIGRPNNIYIYIYVSLGEHMRCQSIELQDSGHISIINFMMKLTIYVRGENIVI